MNERLKKLRKALDLTQQEFADRIGVKRNTIATYEIGRNTPLDAVIASICREFNVSEEWLRTGKGEMFEKLSEEDELSAMVERLITGESAAFKKRLVNALSTLKDEHWLLLEAKLKEIVDMRTAAPAVVDSKIETLTQATPDLAAKVAELERQNEEIQQQNQEKDKQLQELSARLAAIEEEDALGFLPDTGNLA